MFDNIVANEGHKKITVAFIAFLFFVIIGCGLLAFVSFATFAFLIYAYRYKYIDINALEEDKIYAPISGKVTAIDVKDFKKSIYIDVSLCDSHILRSLDNGNAEVSIIRGVNLPTSSYKSKKLNERATIKYENSSMKLFSSTCNDTINLIEKDIFTKGEKIGTFLHGQIIVTLDEKYQSTVSIGEEIQSGITVIGDVKKNS